MTAELLPDQELARGVTDVRGPEGGDRRHWGVTTLLSMVGDKNPLMGWNSNITAACALDDRETWETIERNKGRDEALKWIAGARWRPPKGQRTASELGTAVHQAAEVYARTGEKPSVDDDVQPFLDQFDRWLEEWQPRYLASEFTVYSETYGYAGTGDAILEVLDPQAQEWLRLLVDYKTSREPLDRGGRPKQPFPESALQLSAYRFADLAAIARVRRFSDYGRRYYLLNDWERKNAVPMPEVAGGGVLYITPEACDLFPVRCDETIFDAFLAVVDAARFVLQTSQTVIGAPMVKP